LAKKTWGNYRFLHGIFKRGNGRLYIKGLIPLVGAYCVEHGYTHRAAKDTAMVERCFINYGNNSHPLKIEASYRRSTIPSIEMETINGIRVYGIEPLCVMKTTAYAGRDKIRDLYDVAFICNNYYDRLTAPTVALLRNAVEHKGIEQFDYVVRNQPDDLIDNEKLAEDFLKMYERLGLLLDEEERKLLTQNANNGANGVHFNIHR